MARDDDYEEDEVYVDPMANIANGMVILTTLFLLGAIFAMWQLTADMYGTGPLA